MITKEALESVNRNLRTIPVKGKDYVEVNQRIKAFRSICPAGSITTDIISLEDGVITVKATICDEDGRILATGLAQEKESSSYINKTSFVENGETSAVGRALGMLGIGIDGSVASAEEVTNAINNQEKESKPKATRAGAIPQGNGARQKLIDYCRETNTDMKEVAKEFHLTAKSREEAFEQAFFAVQERSKRNAGNSQN